MKVMAVVLLMGALGFEVAAHRRRPDSTIQPAAGVLHAQVAAGRTPAVQYRHFTRDSLLHSYSEGPADIASGELVSEATRFKGFSVTKTLTAVAVLQLVDRGLIELEAAASDYLPDFPYGEAITVRHLLSHSAGIPNPLPLRWTHLTGEHSAFDSRSVFAVVLAANGKTTARPNTRMRYSNLGYVLLGQIVENVTGLRFERFVTENILSPIGLTPAELGFTIDSSSDATGYHRRRSFSRFLLRFMIDDADYLAPGRSRWQAFRPYYVNGAAYGGLVGTADGFTKYVQALLDPDGGLLTPESHQALFTENVLEGGKRSGMALSWYRGELDGHTYHAHAGGGGGFYAEIRIYPDLRRGSVLFFNRTGFSDARFLDRVDREVLLEAESAGGGVARPAGRRRTEGARSACSSGRTSISLRDALRKLYRGIHQSA